jgi:hypothetical protein
MGGRVVGEMGLAPRAAGMSTLSSNATGSAPSEVDLETRGALAGGKIFFMVDLRMLLFFNGLFKSVVGKSERRGKLIAVKLRSLTAVGRSAQ